MAVGDITAFENASATKMGGAMKFLVVAGTTASIKAGEPVTKVAGAAGVTPAPTNSPTATDRIVGVAASTSTETASADGTVDVIPRADGQVWLISPNNAAAWDTQAEYNALVGSRVLLDLTAGTYTILAADAGGNGCVVEYLDISVNPGKVAFSFSQTADYRI